MTTTQGTISTTTGGGPCSLGDGFYPLPNYCGSNYIICIGGSSYDAVNTFDSIKEKQIHKYSDYK